MRIVCVSDTHTLHERVRVPDGDVLIHAGDATWRGSPGEIAQFDAWLASLPHPHKVVVAGNHDRLFERDPQQARALLRAAHYLEDSGVVLGGIQFWGSPWTPRFHNMAFNLDRGAPLATRWAEIPAGVDVLITHGPPHGVLDEVAFRRGWRVGCVDLTAALERVRPRLHVFGHIHESYGVEGDGQTVFANASTCDLGYQPVHPPLVFDLDGGGLRRVGGEIAPRGGAEVDRALLGPLTRRVWALATGKGPGW